METQTTVTTIYLYKGLIILAGLFFVYLGYKLFTKGITAPAGDMEVGAEGKGTIKLMKFAPGIFFALVGTVVVVVGITRPFSISAPDTRIDTQPVQPETTVITDTIAPAPQAEGGEEPAPVTPQGDGQREEGGGGRTGGGNGTGGGGGARGDAGTGRVIICDTCVVR